MEEDLDILSGTSERSSTGQGILQEGGKNNCNNFSVNVYVSEQPDLSLLLARVCGPMAEKLQDLSGSVLQYHGEPHMA
jgi:hypothetical protein